MNADSKLKNFISGPARDRLKEACDDLNWRLSDAQRICNTYIADDYILSNLPESLVELKEDLEGEEAYLSIIEAYYGSSSLADFVKDCINGEKLCFDFNVDTQNLLSYIKFVEFLDEAYDNYVEDFNVVNEYLDNVKNLLEASNLKLEEKIAIKDAADIFAKNILENKIPIKENPVSLQSEYDFSSLNEEIFNLLESV